MRVRNALVRCAVLATSLLALSLPRAHAEEPRVARFAVVIGNNRPDGSERAPSAASNTLRYADDDALAMHRLLIETGADSVLLTRLDADSRAVYPEMKPDGLPRLDELELALSELEERIQAALAAGLRAELAFYYSGHGDVEAGEGFIALEDQRLTRSMLFDYLSRSAATHQHVFIDACKSYYLVFERGPGGRSSRLTHLELDAHIPARLANTGFVLSTASDRESHEWERYQGGILSHELRSALRGSADTNLDGQVSYAELGAFFTKANVAIQNPRHRPDFLLRAPGGNLGRAIVDWGDTPPGLRVRAGLEQPFYVETARGERLLDAYPASDQALSLHVGAERPVFVRRKDGQGEVALETPEPREVAELAATTQPLGIRGPVSLAYEQLFTLPLGEADVREFEAQMKAARLAHEQPAGPWRRATGIFALGAGGLAATLSGLSLATYLQSEGGSQREIATSNREVRWLNRAAIASAGAAAIAGVMWSWPALWSASVSPVPGDGALLDGWVLDVQLSF